MFRAGLPILPRPTIRHRAERRRGGLAVKVLFVQLRGLPILSSKGQHLQIPFGGSPCAPILRLIHCICQGCCQNFVLNFRPPLQKPLGSLALLLGSLMCPSACPCMPLSLRFLRIRQPLWLTQFWRQHHKLLPCGRLQSRIILRLRMLQSLLETCVQQCLPILLLRHARTVLLPACWSLLTSPTILVSVFCTWPFRAHCELGALGFWGMPQLLTSSWAVSSVLLGRVSPS